jgi:hypothetical protein
MRMNGGKSWNANPSEAGENRVVMMMMVMMMMMIMMMMVMMM